MRKQFPGYYFPKDTEFSLKFQECVFCFDTNVLLNLYRYTPESRSNLIKVLEVFKDRVWLPHQVGFEYQRRRTDVLLGQIGLTGKIKGILDVTIGQLEQLRRSSLFLVNSMIDPIKSDINKIKINLEKTNDEKPNLMTGDPVFDAITDLFDGKVGTPYKDERHKEIYKSGKERYAAKIPPGYMDRSKDPNDTDQYGDLVLWYQILDYAKTESRPIILVTDDAKEDWWREVNGEKLGPRPELISEFLAATNEDKWFYMYSTEQFLKYAKEHLAAEVQPEVIKEAEGIERTDVEQEKLREAFARTNFRANTLRNALAHVSYPSEEIRRALANASYPSEEIRNALAHASYPSEELRNALANASYPSEELRNALANASYPSEGIRNALAHASYHSEELRNALAQMRSTPRIKTNGNSETEIDSQATEAKPKLECVKEKNHEQTSAAEETPEPPDSAPDGED